jgi:ribonuclease HI
MTTTVEYLSTQISKEIRKKESSMNCQFNISKKIIKKHLRSVLISIQNLDPKFSNTFPIQIQEITLRTFLNTYIKPLFKFIIGGKRFSAFKRACLRHIHLSKKKLRVLSAIIHDPIRIYIDASYMPDSGEIGVGMVICNKGRVTTASGCYEIGTINRHGAYWAELKGIHQALIHARTLQEKNPSAKIEIFSDCESVLMALETNHPPSNLFRRAKRTFNKSNNLLKQSLTHTSLNWVRAHCGHKYNEMADKLATQARKSHYPELVFINQ